jgi:hypothetical protein
VQKLLIFCQSPVARVKVLSHEKRFGGRAAGYLPGVDGQSTRGQRVFHASIRPVIFHNPLFHKALASTAWIFAKNSSLLLTATAIYIE